MRSLERKHDMKLTLITPIIALVASGALAAGSHDGGHGHGEMMGAGMPGMHTQVSRTVEVTMMETDDGMAFAPENMMFKEGETVRFKLTNTGEMDHEFVLDTVEKNREHAMMMAKFPEMEHDDPNAIRLAPGETGEIVWTFAKPGAFQYACLIPGHMEAGMHGPVTVSNH
jgi:uncharacterized cupredoxin-like copper-binding protein